MWRVRGNRVVPRISESCFAKNNLRERRSGSPMPVEACRLLCRAPTRWFHWINALTVLGLILVGTLILFAGVVDLGAAPESPGSSVE